MGQLVPFIILQELITETIYITLLRFPKETQQDQTSEQDKTPFVFS